MPNRFSLTDVEVADAVLAIRERDGRDPRTSADDPLERYLARRMWKVTDPTQKARIGERVRPGAAKALAVAAFIAENGYTPRMNRPEEAELGQWLITYARPRHREGRLPDYIVDILSRTPQALATRDTPNQGDRVSELRAFVERHKRLPRQHVAEERSLSAWMYAQRPQNRKEGTESYRRCVEVQGIIETYRGRNIASKRESRIEMVRAYVAENGHLPQASVIVGLEDEFPDVMSYSEHRENERLEALRAYIAENGHLPPTNPSDPIWVMTYRARTKDDPFSLRVKELVQGVPTASAATKTPRRTSDQRLEDLRAFIAERGVLPGPSSDGNLYRWMYYAARRDDETAAAIQAMTAGVPKASRGRPRAADHDGGDDRKEERHDVPGQ